MSAYLCEPVHIATCAEIIYSRTYLFNSGYRGMGIPDIAQRLASENWKSVSFRYSPMGQESYEKLLQSIEVELASLGWQAKEVLKGADLENDLPGPAHVSSYSDYILKSRMARPVDWKCATLYSPGDWLSWFGCLNYQSCEHDGWERSEARMWILEAEAAIAHELAERNEPAISGMRDIIVSEDKA